MSNRSNRANLTHSTDALDSIDFPDSSDEELLARYHATSDQWAFSVIYQRRRYELMQFIRHHLWQHPEVNDPEAILQQVFTDLHTIKRLRPGGTVRGLLYKLAARRTADYIRTARSLGRGGGGAGRHRIAPPWTRCSQAAVDIVISGRQMVTEERRRMIGDLIDHLPDEEANMIRLFLAGHKVPSAAKVSNCSANVAEWQLKKGLGRLRKLLDATWPK